MTIGIIGNTSKSEIGKAVIAIAGHIRSAGMKYLISEKLKPYTGSYLAAEDFAPSAVLCVAADIIFSVGGDGTMLTTAYTVIPYGKPVLGINFGNLGFLAEAELDQLESVLQAISRNRVSVEERTVLSAVSSQEGGDILLAVNDLVVNRGGYPRMIEMTIKVNEHYVTTFSADGIIIATPTGSTGYSLSTGGPVVVPDAKVIALSPISPHSLNMRHLILHEDSVITVKVSSHPSTVQVSSDGQRVSDFLPPMELLIRRYEKNLRIMRPGTAGYFEILRSKLSWGLDARKKRRDEPDNGD